MLRGQTYKSRFFLSGKIILAGRIGFWSIQLEASRCAHQSENRSPVKPKLTDNHHCGGDMRRMIREPGTIRNYAYSFYVLFGDQFSHFDHI